MAAAGTCCPEMEATSAASALSSFTLTLDRRSLSCWMALCAQQARRPSCTAMTVKMCASYQFHSPSLCELRTG